MTMSHSLWSLLPVWLVLSLTSTSCSCMELWERVSLREEARDMFYHGYHAYMDVAFPADELMPLSCKGRFRGSEPSRGDIDDVMGNFSVTLIDSLDMLVVLGDLQEFEEAVKKVVDHVHFDRDVVVSVFETNIRVVGGLVSAHVLSEFIRDSSDQYMSWYTGELLDLAVDLGFRLLPAFNTVTGLPHPRVNLKHGLKQVANQVGETCTACAGTMILEFAALSRLSGEKVFESKASKAMDVLWSLRNRHSNLVGNVLNVNTGDWVRSESGLGAGIDSYYEYVAKAYVLLGDDNYLHRWKTHYEAVMKYLGGPVPRDVHMHKPTKASKHFTDALWAFWPGLQVLMGDIKPAIEMHEILYQITQRHSFIPEAFTTDFHVHWGQHFLRPEFMESTYFLYRATGDSHYLEVGKNVMKAIQRHARVPCGYATIGDVRTMHLDDRMDSFVLSETFKYLYLLFSEDKDLMIDIDSFVFTTEAHLLPLSLARLSNHSAVSFKSGGHVETTGVDMVQHSCPSLHHLFPDNHETFVQDLRSPLANAVNDRCPVKKRSGRAQRKFNSVSAAEFKPGDPKHIESVKRMGITLMSMPDGRLQLYHSVANAVSAEAAEEGLAFMQEMLELSKEAANAEKEQADQHALAAKNVVFFDEENGKMVTLTGGPAQFGLQLDEDTQVSGAAVLADPETACDESILLNGEDFKNKIVIVRRGDCMFIEKARVVEALGGIACIVVDNVPESSVTTTPAFAMSGDNTDDVDIPLVFLFTLEGQVLIDHIKKRPNQLHVTLSIEQGSHEDKESDADEDNFGFNIDLTSPVKAFLKLSKLQLERLLDDVRSHLPATNEGSISRESKIQDPDGDGKDDDGLLYLGDDEEGEMESDEVNVGIGSVRTRSLSDEEVSALNNASQSSPSLSASSSFLSKVLSSSRLDAIFTECVQLLRVPASLDQLTEAPLLDSRRLKRRLKSIAELDPGLTVKMLLPLLEDNKTSILKGLRLSIGAVTILENLANRLDSATNSAIDYVLETITSEEEQRFVDYVLKSDMEHMLIRWHSFLANTDYDLSMEEKKRILLIKPVITMVVDALKENASVKADLIKEEL